MRRSALWLLLSTVLGALALVAAEGLLRAAYPERVRDTGEVAYEPDETMIVRLSPGRTHRYTRAEINGGQVITWHTNAQGFRGPALSERGEPRVVVYGDSNVQARFSAHEDTFAAQLQRRLDARIEVINAGLVSAGPDQYLLGMERDLLRLKPSAVVWVLTVENDLGDLVRNRLLELRGDDLVAVPQPLLADVTLRLGAGFSRWAQDLLVVRAARRLWASAQGSGEWEVDHWIRGHLDYQQRAWALYQDGEPRDLSHFHDAYEIDVALVPDGEVAAQKRRLLTAVLRRAASHHMPMLAVLVPSSIDATNNGEVGPEQLQQREGYRPRTLTDLFARACDEAGVPHVDLWPAFQQAGASELYFRGSDTHWNDAGQALAARQVAPALRRLLQL